MVLTYDIEKVAYLYHSLYAGIFMQGGGPRELFWFAVGVLKSTDLWDQKNGSR